MTDFGVVTTPQLHFVVRQSNLALNVSVVEEAYYVQILDSYRKCILGYESALESEGTGCC